jgi:hypothetical protein
MNIWKGKQLNPVTKLLPGPAGAGKSCMLYALAHYASRLGLLILYLPNCAPLCNLSPKMLAKTILRVLRDYNPNWPYRNLYVEDVHVVAVAREAMEQLRFGKHPACIFLDQWNCVSKDNSTNYFKSLFGTFTISSCKTALLLLLCPLFPWPHHLVELDVSCTLLN